MFLTPGRVRMQTPVFGLPAPFARGALHVPVPAPASHAAPQQRWFIFCPQRWVNADEAQTKQTRLLCTFFQSKNRSQPLPHHSISLPLPHSRAAGAHLLPTAPVGTDPIPHQGWGARDVRRAPGRIKSEKQRDQRAAFCQDPQIFLLCFILPCPKSTRRGCEHRPCAPPGPI